MDAKDSTPGAWSPLSFPLFRWVWLATLVSNIGVWFQEVAAGWLMTNLNPSPLLVSLVQAANTLPLLLLGLPAGALADLLDRRKLLLTTTLWMTFAAALLALFQMNGTLNATGLLVLVAAVAVGAALSAPAWSAIVHELVPRSHLPAATALNSLGINIARAIGPAFAGVVLSFAGPGVAFACNALSFLGVVFVLWGWRREHKQEDLPSEQFMWAMASGIQYVRHAPAFVAVLVRSFCFAAFAVVLWALLPLITRDMLAGDASDYGLMLAAIGLGAVTGALFLPKLRPKLGPERLTFLATTLYVGVLATLAIAPPFWAALLLMALAGFAWITMLSTLHVSAQLLVPAWVRARGLSISLMVFFGSMALGSITWGTVGSQLGLPQTLMVAAACLFIAQASALRFKLPRGKGPNLTPSRHWPAPDPDIAEDHGAGGHVLVLIRYKVDATDETVFFQAAHEVRRFRLRSGAFAWRMYRDPDNEGWFCETFMNRNWHDHLRLHDRITEEDRVAQENLHQFHRDDAPPKVTHLINQG